VDDPHEVVRGGVVDRDVVARVQAVEREARHHERRDAGVGRRAWPWLSRRAAHGDFRPRQSRSRPASARRRPGSPADDGPPPVATRERVAAPALDDAERRRLDRRPAAVSDQQLLFPTGVSSTPTGCLASGTPPPSGRRAEVSD
jgi:hypothetical protein